MSFMDFAMNGVCKKLLCVLTKQFLLSSKKLHTFEGEGFKCVVFNVDALVKSLHPDENRSPDRLELFDIT